MDKIICFRFDIDTHICLKHGVPNILKLFKKYNGYCTFFVNMGRSFSLEFLLKEKLKETWKTQKKEKVFFSMVSKLGILNSIEAILLNPKVGPNYSAILHDIISSGHELGLHGGRNHAKWEKEVLYWDREKIQDEVIYGLNQFEKLGLPKPLSFASPCWQSPKILASILSDLNFLILADTISIDDCIYKKNENILEIPTNVIGKQSDVGFVENLRALGYSSIEIIEEFSQQLDKEGNFKMVFDHPLYIGVKELDVLSKMIDIAIRKGFKLDSLNNTYRLNK